MFGVPRFLKWGISNARLTFDMTKVIFTMAIENASASNPIVFHFELYIEMFNEHRNCFMVVNIDIDHHGHCFKKKSFVASIQGTIYGHCQAPHHCQAWQQSAKIVLFHVIISSLTINLSKCNIRFVFRFLMTSNMNTIITTGSACVIG